MMHINRSRSVFRRHSLNIIFETFFCIFQHVVLVGGFAASDWIFFKVHELLTPLGINIVRAENYVWVFFQDQNDTVLKETSLETKLFRMARSHSTSTTSWELAFPNLHMVSLPLSHTTQMTQITSRGLKMCTPLLLGSSGSMEGLALSCPKWVVYSLTSKVCY